MRDVHVYTPSDFNFHYAWLSVHGRSHVVFEARGCHDFHLALSFIPGTWETQTYHIVIGGWGNTQSAIKAEVGGDSLVDAYIDGLCSCDHFRPFWVEHMTF